MSCASRSSLNTSSLYAYYNFKENKGQVIFDNSGKENHLVLGSTLLQDESDPILTDRGIYFQVPKYASLPPNALFPLKSMKISSFYMVLFVFITYPGTILTITSNDVTNLRLSQENNIFQITFFDGAQTTHTEISSLTSTTESWDSLLIGLINESTSPCLSRTLTLRSKSFTQNIEIPSTLSSSTSYNITLGNISNSFTGFISELMIFSPTSCSDALEAFSFTDCLSTIHDPYYSNNGEPCYCGIFSCLSQDRSCIKCDDSCGLYCRVSSNSCLEIENYCDPFLIKDGLCNTNLLKVINCQVQELSAVCITCKSGYVLGFNSSACCLPDQYSIAQGSCLPCHSSCLTCNDEGSANCTTCRGENAVLVNGTCFCPLNSFFNGSSCIACMPECGSCRNFDSCESCNVSSFVLENGRCKCPDGFYVAGNGSCLPCHNNCLTCFSGSIDGCFNCKDLNAHKEFSNGMCYCNDGFFSLDLVELQCLACHEICKTCKGSAVIDCLDCKDTNSAVVDSLCTCNSGYYINQNNPGTCSPCDKTCLTCSGPTEKNCTNCISPYMTLHSGVCSCMNSGYFEELSQTCIICPSLCRKCSSNQNCFECESSSLQLKEGQCECPERFYWNSSSFQCEKCHSDCFSCTGPLIDECLLCSNQSIFNSEGRCSCGYSKFVSGLNPLQCSSCFDNCASCEGELYDQCYQCKSSLMEVVNGSCQCVQGFFLDKLNNCSKCHESCLTCNDSNNISCTSCNKTSVLKQGTCLPCEKNCEKCEETGRCLDCQNQTFIGDDGTCQPCHKSCKTCEGPTENQCNSCLNISHRLENSSGVCECRENQFILSQDPFICANCSKNCLKCSENKCFSCEKGFNLNFNSCFRITFKVSLEVLQNNSVFLSFSKPLQRRLNENDLYLKKDRKNLIFSLIYHNKSTYTLKVDDYGSISGHSTVFLTFEAILSDDLSLLDPLEYNFIITQANSTLSKVLKRLKTAIVSSAVGGGLSSAFINNNDPYIWISINTIQVLSYAPLLNLDLPEFLRDFMAELRPLDLIDLSWFSSKVFSCDSRSINPRFYSYGFTCKHFLNNSVEIFVPFIFGLVFGLILLGLRFLPFIKVKMFCGTKLKSYKYSFFLRFWIQAYIELLIPSVISINNLSISSKYSKINSTIGFIFTVNVKKIVLFITPIFVILFYKSRHDQIKSNNEEFLFKYSTLVNDFRIESKFLWWIPLFLVEKIIFIYSLYQLNNPILQIIICALIPFCNIFYLIYFKIFKEEKTQKMFIFQEIIVFSVFMMISGYLNDLEDDVKVYLGYAIISVIIFGVSAGTISSLVSSAKLIYSKCKRKSFNTAINKVVSVDDIPHVIDQYNFFENTNFLKIKNQAPLNSKIQSSMNSLDFNSPSISH